MQCPSSRRRTGPGHPNSNANVAAPRMFRPHLSQYIIPHRSARNHDEKPTKRETKKNHKKREKKKVPSSSSGGRNFERRRTRQISLSLLFLPLYISSSRFRFSTKKILPWEPRSFAPKTASTNGSDPSSPSHPTAADSSIQTLTLDQAGDWRRDRIRNDVSRENLQTLTLTS